MFAALLAGLKSFFGAIGAIFQWLGQKQLIDAGKAEEQADELQQAQRDEAISHEIDSRHRPDNPDDTLKRL